MVLLVLFNMCWANVVGKNFETFPPLFFFWELQDKSFPNNSISGFPLGYFGCGNTYVHRAVRKEVTL